MGLRLAAVKAFERWIRQWAHERANSKWRNRESAGRAGEDWQDVVRGLDTPWRVASFLNAEVREGPPLNVFQIYQDADVTLTRQVGNAGDFARFAQQVLDLHGVTTRLAYVVDAHATAGQVVCAVWDEDAQGWYHLSNFGLFGVYPDLNAVASDLVPNWTWMWVRIGDMALDKVVQNQEEAS